MACTLLGQVGEHGEDLLAAEPAPSDIDNSVSARGSKKPKAVKEPKARAKKNEVATLSHVLHLLEEGSGARAQLSLISNLES